MHLKIVISADTPSQKTMDLGWGRYGDNGNHGNQRLNSIKIVIEAIDESLVKRFFGLVYSFIVWNLDRSFARFDNAIFIKFNVKLAEALDIKAKMKCKIESYESIQSISRIFSLYTYMGIAPSGDNTNVVRHSRIRASNR